MNRFIGLFDSGMGGLTVLKAVMNLLPEENTVYFGDVGRAPYGSRSPEVLKRYSEQIVRYLTGHYQLKLVVAACNTISAISLGHLKEVFDIPIMGIIDPVPKKAIETTRNGRIGVIGTRRTIQSGVYRQKIEQLSDSVSVYGQECPLLIHLIEEGWTNEPASRMILAEYLSNLKHLEIDTLILGCTHYPMIRAMIQEYMGNGVVIIDPAVACADMVRESLTKGEKLNHDNYPERIYLVTDNADLFWSSGERYLNRKIHKVNVVDIGLLERRD
jgi:glutamate racemase